MNRHPVQSSDLRSVGYDDAARKLEIEFHSGGIYQYSGVPAAVYQGLMRAASKGSYFRNRVKDQYPFTRVR